MKRIHYTFAWDGYTVEYRNGTREQMTASQLIAKYGDKGFYLINKLAHGGGFTGLFHDVTPYVRGYLDNWTDSTPEYWSNRGDYESSQYLSGYSAADAEKLRLAFA